MSEAESTITSQAAAPLSPAVAQWCQTLYAKHPSALGDSAKQMAEIAIALGLGDALAVTAELSPFLRAGAISRNAIAKNAGSEIAQYGKDLMQLFELSLPGQWTPGEQLPAAQGEALRRMLLAVVNDYRLVIVRIAAQLVDLRGARDAPRDEQIMLARDTREIFAPLANRLGIWQLKWELEDFAFRYLQPTDYQEIARQLDGRRAEREHYIGAVTHELNQLMIDAGVKADITGRPKHIYSIYRKMQRKQVSLDQLFDVRAVRIMVDSITECYTALGVVHNRWPYIREEFDDYIANPKGNNYRSLHTAVFGPEGRPLEIQIRTHDMHRQAELGVAAHWRYKEGGAGNAVFEQKITWLRQLLEQDDAASGNTDMLENLSDGLFNDRVYAITPRGDIVDLPAGATPLDFAYQVHTEIGHRCKGARANGRIVTLTYTIENGDRIEIITGKEPQPSRDWLSPRSGFLVSSRNRTKVRSWFRQQDRDVNRRQGREHLERELQRLSIRDLPISKIAEKMGFASTDDLCVALGFGDITTASVFNAAQQLIAPPEAPAAPSKRSRRHKPSGGGSVIVNGTDSVLTQFAGCCNPVPPESIQGYITQGRGITIHRAGCGSVKRLSVSHPERLIDVSWQADEQARYPVSIRIEAADRHGLLKDVSGVLSDEAIRILGNESHSDDRTLSAVVNVRAEVDGLERLSRALNKLTQLPGVTRVSRIS
ncbi:MAG: bifunctional (p)ppGpp synthetase/guanosine-3',5'-bis(diphosphate) 3'-pyrophosphohydrolase [Pseudomonadota bacterium]